MRLFIAIGLSQEAKDHLFALPKKIEGAKIRWTAKKNLHQTLKFFGEVDEKQLELIKNKLSTIKFKKFRASLGNLGAFPNTTNARVIWVGMQPENIINKLQLLIDELFLEDFPSDTTFKSHLTIGRVKLLGRVNELKKFFDETEIKDIEFDVEKFSLIKSTLTSDGPKYRLIEEYDLV
ncbi:MAG: RNA 2',3'-cyclic phosphodiesterase [archaeon]